MKFLQEKTHLDRVLLLRLRGEWEVQRKWSLQKFISVEDPQRPRRCPDLHLRGSLLLGIPIKQIETKIFYKAKRNQCRTETKWIYFLWIRNRFCLIFEIICISNQWETWKQKAQIRTSQRKFKPKIRTDRTRICCSVQNRWNRLTFQWNLKGDSKTFQLWIQFDQQRDVSNWKISDSPEKRRIIAKFRKITVRSIWMGAEMRAPLQRHSDASII